MDGTGFNVEQIVLLHRHLLQIFLHRAVLNAPAQLLLRHIMIQTVYQLRVLFRIEHIPHLRLTELPVFMLTGIRIGGMYLDGQIFFRIDQLDENR